MQKEPYCHPEIWGGLECTISRVGDHFTDQLALTGHYARESDIHRIADLGIKTLRYPILWERHERQRHAHIDWSWAERQLTALRHRQISPIVGLLHHGSGPAFTNLLDPDFPAAFAGYARRVAARFPWVEHYTPVNEPLTTARFSGLYGHWYPHRLDPRDSMTMLINQLKATVLAMHSIRVVNPDAKLIQTEDLAKIHSTPELAYQADFENQRRWLTFDLLMGKVDKHHPLWEYLLFIGIKPRELDFFVQQPCPPDLLGLNYYITSERFLDPALGNYPASLHGGNGKHRYVDTEAFRAGTPAGIAALLAEAWDRYHCPMAITEAHLNCTREEQLRWFKYIWDECCRAKSGGIDIRAVTAWALLGAYDWDSLLTVRNGHYESGAFDGSSTVLRMTALGQLISNIASEGDCDHPVLRSPGWWQRADPTQEFTGDELILTGDGEPHDRLVQRLEKRGIYWRHVESGQNDPDPFSFDEPTACPPWAVISTTSDSVRRKQLAAFCRHSGIAFLHLAEIESDRPDQLDRRLDRFLDESFSSYTTKNKLIPVCQ